MNTLRFLLVLMGLELSAGAQADPASVTVVERVYISPGASGSISTSSRQQSYDSYGGRPTGTGHGPSVNQQGSARVLGNVTQGVDERGMQGGRVQVAPRRP
ncbi:MAG: hypothetical protein ABWY06_08080 [Pseudomonas sp.]|uniref:hypothetical protein n=1 Tax=Pseudomonas sp. TaxID=306 RepID=UPI003396053E